MRRKKYWPFLFFALFLFLIFHFPERGAQNLRAGFIGLAAHASHVKKQESKKLEFENQSLQQQMQRLRGWLVSEAQVQRQKVWLQMMAQNASNATLENEKAFFMRRGRCLAQLIDKELHAFPAKVIFREPGLWNSSLWLNAGEKVNGELGRAIVAKNSPVLNGAALVGIVEEVWQKKCRVRLITDPNLHVAVRAVRGKEQNIPLLSQIEGLKMALRLRSDLPDTKALDAQLLLLEEQLKKTGERRYLAKGELQGCSDALWRGRSPQLKGCGFNYDFSDDEGSCCHLRTGSLPDGTDPIPLIQVGDLLVTSGLDGLFPADLPVAYVSKILTLREGGLAYEIEAVSLTATFDELSELFILPPVS